jgi:hypothetical protein
VPSARAAPWPGSSPDWTAASRPVRAFGRVDPFRRLTPPECHPVLGQAISMWWAQRGADARPLVCRCR